MHGLTFNFLKTAADGSYVRGWASVVSIDGEPVVDFHGDMISIDELRKSAHDFMLNVRVAKHEHGRDGIVDAAGDVVEAIIVDDDLAKALGITDGRRGLFIGMKISNEVVKAKIRAGELTAFSIGGRGQRIAA